jgi:adenylate kinase
MRLILIGPPGSGKGTQAKLLSQRLGLTHISTGDMLREAIRIGSPAGIKAKPFVESGHLVADDLVNETIADYFRLDNAPTDFILDGYPRTLPQAVSFDQLMRQLHLGIDAALYLKIDDQEVVNRLAGRGRKDDVEATIRKRLQVFHSTYGGLLDYYRRLGLLHEINGAGDMKSVNADILKVLHVS